MRFDGKTNKQKATDLKISKLSVCVTPAHEGALATIIKSAAVKELDMDGLKEILSTSEGKKAINDVIKRINDINKEGETEMSDEKKLDDSVKKVEKEAVEETFTANGTTIRKSEVGEGVFNLMKSQQDQIEKAQKATAIEKDKRELQEFMKQAELLYPNLPGEVANKGMIMKAMSAMPTEARDTLSAMLKAGNEAIDTAKLFKEVGSDGIPMDDGSPLSKLNKMAEAKSKADGTSNAVAYTAVLATPEGNALYQKSLQV